MMTPVSSPIDPKAAAAPSATGGQEAPPHDLFAALMALLGALPLPQADAPPPEGSVRPDEPAAPSEDDAREAPTDAEAAAALAAVLTPPPVLAALVLPTAPNVASDAASEALAATRGAGGVATAPSPLPIDPVAFAPLEPQAGSVAPAPADAPAPRAAEAIARPATPDPALAAALAPLPAEAPVVQPVTIAPGAANARPSAEAAARLHARIGAVHATPSPNAPAAPAGPPDAGLEPLPADTARSEATRPELLAAPTRTSAPALADAAPIEASSRTRTAESVQPVVANALWLAEQGGGQARLALSPPELGQVEILVRVRGHRVEVHLRVEEAAAQQAVRDTRDQLSDALASRELRMETFSVNGGGSGATGNDFREAARDGGERPQFFQRTTGEARPAFAAPRGVASAPIASASAIDLRV